MFHFALVHLNPTVTCRRTRLNPVGCWLLAAQYLPHPYILALESFCIR